MSESQPQAEQVQQVQQPEQAEELEQPQQSARTRRSTGSEPVDLGKSPAPEPEPAPGPAPAPRRRPLRLPRRRGVRRVLGAAVVVVLGVVAVGAGVALERRHERGVPVFDRAHAGRGPVRVPDVPGLPDLPGLPGRAGKLVVRGEDGSVQVIGGDGALRPGSPVVPDGAGPDGSGPVGNGPVGRLAPAALPAVPADQALAKAVAAVPNGKAATLAVVPREGGGSSWSVEVLGPDGVRHLVTVDGADGSVTGNTVAAGR
ncbi:PepSY domain-containing protein [Kitasatospora fiedleri]|uniref:PepSY domain-containing protein n=1 Tax=Kitasatospora fiedleri TaxID=2991545 RepID=UPI00249A33ED|nr:PepSY domain-containing protein [Kitasatospora fiedleri]